MSTDLLQGDCEFEAKPGPHREVQMLLRSRVVIPQCYLLTTCSKMSSALLCGFHSQGVFVVSKWTCSPCLNFSLKKNKNMAKRKGIHCHQENFQTSLSDFCFCSLVKTSNCKMRLYYPGTLGLSLLEKQQKWCWVDRQQNLPFKA